MYANDDEQEEIKKLLIEQSRNQVEQIEAERDRAIVLRQLHQLKAKEASIKGRMADFATSIAIRIAREEI